MSFVNQIDELQSPLDQQNNQEANQSTRSISLNDSSRRETSPGITSFKQLRNVKLQHKKALNRDPSESKDNSLTDFAGKLNDLERKWNAQKQEQPSLNSLNNLNIRAVSNKEHYEKAARSLEKSDPKNYSLTGLKTDRSESYEPLFGSKENNAGSIENDIDSLFVFAKKDVKSDSQVHKPGPQSLIKLQMSPEDKKKQSNNNSVLLSQLNSPKEPKSQLPSKQSTLTNIGQISLQSPSTKKKKSSNNSSGVVSPGKNLKQTLKQSFREQQIYRAKLAGVSPDTIDFHKSFTNHAQIDLNDSNDSIMLQTHLKHGKANNSNVLKARHSDGMVRDNVPGNKKGMQNKTYENNNIRRSEANSMLNSSHVSSASKNHHHLDESNEYDLAPRDKSRLRNGDATRLDFKFNQNKQNEMSKNFVINPHSVSLINSPHQRQENVQSNRLNTSHQPKSPSQKLIDDKINLTMESIEKNFKAYREQRDINKMKRLAESEKRKSLSKSPSIEHHASTSPWAPKTQPTRMSTENIITHNITHSGIPTENTISDQPAQPQTSTQRAKPTKAKKNDFIEYDYLSSRNLARNNSNASNKAPFTKTAATPKASSSISQKSITTQSQFKTTQSQSGVNLKELPVKFIPNKKPSDPSNNKARPRDKAPGKDKRRGRTPETSKKFDSFTNNSISKKSTNNTTIEYGGHKKGTESKGATPNTTTIKEHPKSGFSGKQLVVENIVNVHGVTHLKVFSSNSNNTDPLKDAQANIKQAALLRRSYEQQQNKKGASTNGAGTISVNLGSKRGTKNSIPRTNQNSVSTAMTNQSTINMSNIENKKPNDSTAAEARKRSKSNPKKPDISIQATPAINPASSGSKLATPKDISDPMIKKPVQKENRQQSGYSKQKSSTKPSTTPATTSSGENSKSELQLVQSQRVITYNPTISSSTPGSKKQYSSSAKLTNGTNASSTPANTNHAVPDSIGNVNKPYSSPNVKNKFSNQGSSEKKKDSRGLVAGVPVPNTLVSHTINQIHASLAKKSAQLNSPSTTNGKQLNARDKLYYDIIDKLNKEKTISSASK